MKTFYYNSNNYIKVYNADCLEIMQRLVNKGMQVDAIITDPPYGYLDHKLDREFDNYKFFELAYRLIKKDGFLIFFGRGVENAHRMVVAEDVGFKFKEEIVWNKKIISSPTLPLGRIHEIIYIFTKSNGTINKVKKSFLDEIFNVNDKDYIQILENDIKRIISCINSIKTYDDFLKWKNGDIKNNRKIKFGITHQYNIYYDVAFGTFKKYDQGALLKSIITHIIS